mgnify:CR=1 FL=1
MKNVNKQFDDDLKQCNNMDQVLDVVQKHYDLSKPMGLAVKMLVFAGIRKIIDMVKAQPRTTITK